MEPAFRLSHGRAQLRGAAVGAGEEPRARAIAPEARYAAERRRQVAAAPPTSPGEIEAAAVPPASADAIDAAAHEAAGVAASRAKTKTKARARAKVAVPPEATAKRKSGRARKATA